MTYSGDKDKYPITFIRRAARSRGMGTAEDYGFTDKPCSECKKDGGPTGFLVKADCRQCMGSGRERKL